ncbi:pentapeptide repeat-containing protein [Nocardia sp. 852002-20019_SCH5090214]|uniref:pentapeptide repeat-containing protein n=1 Tax=Nocardia sp. 852002-20019_SCH5090214 TaxID=1834087 RepID=UPI0018D32913|nr:pentapeptide repeat-containing protein [Nocardia sp. 852002-20019_SCH5090214]
MSADGAQARTTVKKRRANGNRMPLRRRASRVQLFPAVTAALMAGIVVAFTADVVMRWITPTNYDTKAAPIEVTKVALTIVAGVGGVVALVIAYRRQRDLEQSRFVERFGAAAAQLGATDVAVRIAGVYAMAGVADESDGLRRQQCIDVLCGYLRLPYNAEHGASGRTKLVVKAPRVDHGRVRGETEEHIEYRQNDREVRATVVRVIADRLRPEAEYSWSTSNFDFRTAHLEAADFAGTIWSGTTRFTSANFTGVTRFVGATFNSPVWFDSATFGNDARFDGATFNGRANFGWATFGPVGFDEATFNGPLWFAWATVGPARFEKATFNGGPTVFATAIFNGPTRFDGAIFNGLTTRFEAASFNDDAWFDGAIFSGEAIFRRILFSGRASFRQVDFGSEPIIFADPLRWGPPPPEFDWHGNGEGRPANVEPQDWPPVVVTPEANSR